MQKKQQYSKWRISFVTLILGMALLHTGCGFSAPSDLTITVGEKTTDVVRRYKAPEDEDVGAYHLDNIIWTDSDEDGRIDGVTINERCKGYTLAGLEYGQSFDNPPQSLYDGNFQFYEIQEGYAVNNAFYRGTDNSKYSNYFLRIRYSDHIISIALTAADISEEEQDLASATPEPTPSPTQDPAATTQFISPYDIDDDEDDYDYDDTEVEQDGYDDAYVIPDSATRKLTKKDIEGLTPLELRIARNEIYARHGRMFQDAELQSYFDMQSWYVGTIAPEDFVDSEQLSKLEQRNAKFIKKYE